MHESRTFALALEQIEGVGRVTAARLLAAFATYDDLLRYPREQVLTRLKGVPSGAAIVARLFDESDMRERLTRAETALEALAGRGVHVLTPRDPDWPTGLNDLPASRRPVVLYAYGNRAVLRGPIVAFFARPPLFDAAFEDAQALLGHLVQHGIHPATATATGFDVVVQKRSAAAAEPVPPLLVAACGMARLQPAMRPTVSAAVRTGGLFVSPFAMEHGPFEYDDTERALVQAAIAGAAVFVDPQPDTPEWHALEWALEAGRPAFGIAGADPAPCDRLHRLASEIDRDWVVAAVNVGASRTS